MDIIQVIVTFVVGLVVGLLVAWFYWRQQLVEGEQLRGQVSEGQATIRDLTAQLEERNQAISQLKSAATSRAAEAPVLEKPKPDNLARIEGIGPKISQVLQDAGIMTFEQLAAADVSRLEQILTGAGMRLAEPSTWPEQARLAAAGDWQALETLQDELTGGRRA
jgi:predicted flap endonuclease-1-like 5' DNA nuclease